MQQASRLVWDKMAWLFKSNLTGFKEYIYSHYCNRGAIGALVLFEYILKSVIL